MAKKPEKSLADAPTPMTDEECEAYLRSDEEDDYDVDDEEDPREDEDEDNAET